ncbi:uncharacterized protein LOC115719269 [Cannabis sativa]|uniref:uncharacterized protein LOC115719269 n=1 Tax=Cannabis sativa TaxID=3483 RepID=UPI0029CA0DEF|nr:uncharacterized protein LOC115719269 [Cannabis sativa]
MMGFSGFLQILLTYFLRDLAWPLLAFVYPSYCSVKAIEVNTLQDAQKLNAYWIVLSLILLIEHALGTLLQRLPFWTYIRLVVVCWLVIPHFDAAFYVYKHLLHPCFSIINCSNQEKKNQAETETTNARENGYELVLDNIASKSNSINFDVAVVKDINSKDVVKEEVTSANQLRQAEPTQLLIENKNFVASETKRKIVQHQAAVRDFPSASNVVHNKWTCLICKVTTETEINKNSHLRGKKHKAAYEALKANNLTSLLKIVPPPIPKKSDKVSKQKATASNQFSNEHKEEPKTSTSRRSRRENKLGMEHGDDGKDTEKSRPYKVPSSTKVKNALRCRICNVECSSSISMQSHLKGRMHLAQLGLSK